MANDIQLNEFKLKDPVTSLPDGLNDPLQKAPGFFGSLKNPLDLWLEESLPASMYQWMTGNTKKKQAQEALDFLNKYPDLQGSSAYQNAKRILDRFGYLLEEGGEFSLSEFGNLIKKHPGLVGGELLNTIVADPWLLAIPFFGVPKFGRGIVNLIRKAFPSKLKPAIFKGIALQPATPDLAMGALATLSLPLLFSVNYQLSEDLKFSGKRTTAETTIGATAGLLFGGLIKTSSLLLSPRTMYDPSYIAKVAAASTKGTDWTGDIHAFEKILNDLEGNWRSKGEKILLQADPKYDVTKEFLNLSHPPERIIRYARRHYENKKSNLEGIKNELKSEIGARTDKEFWQIPIYKFKDQFRKRASWVKRNRWLIETDLKDLDGPAKSLMVKKAFEDHLDNFQELNDKIRPGLQNAETLAQNSVYKIVRPYLTAGAVVGGAQFLTSDDEKLLAAGKGAVLGAAALGGLKLGYKFIRNRMGKELGKGTSKWERDQISFSDEKYRTMKFLVAQGERDAYHAFNWLKTNIPDQQARNSFGAYLLRPQGPKAHELPAYNKYIKSQGIEPIESLKEFSTKYKVDFKNIEKTIGKNLFDIGQDFQKLRVIEDLMDNYFPVMYEAPLTATPDAFRASISKIYGESRVFWHARQRQFPNAWEGIKAGHKLRTVDVAEIFYQYLRNANKTYNTRLLIRDLTTRSAHTLKYKADPRLTTEEFASQRMPYIINDPRYYNKIQAHVGHNVINDLYVKFDHPFLTNSPELIPRVHKSIHPWLKLIFEAQTENQIVQSMFLINHSMKRLNVGFSFFHAGALVESMLFAHWNPRHAFKIIGLKKSEVQSMWQDPKAWADRNFSMTANTLENATFRDPIAFAEGVGLTLSKYGVEDQDFTRFKSVMRKADAVYTNLVPWKKVTNDLGVRPAAMEKAFDWFDGITWDKIFSSAKLYTFMVNFEKLAAKQIDRAGKLNEAQLYRIGQNAATVTNDSFGGLDWYRIAMNTQSPMLRDLAWSTFRPSSRGWLQLVFFAPDWTIANLRIIGKALPGVTKDPDLARIYQMYAIRAAIYYGTIGTALNYIFSGHSQLENTDPTRIDLGNGEVLTFSKQLMEPLHWATNPQKTAIKKIGSLPRTTLELLFNKKYLTTGWSPQITKKDDTAIDRALKVGGHTSMRFLPIWLQSSVRTVADRMQKEGISADLAADVATEYVLGQTGHPKYKGPRTSQYKTKGLIRSPYETLF
jgi:hypothetical protein